jgi:hypothetical protein
MMTFKDFYSNKPLQTKKRHMNPMLRDVSSHSKHPGRVVPHMHRTVKSNQKVESLKNRNNGRFVCNDNDVREIESEFNLQLDRAKAKSLGNTGITLRFDPVLNAAVLEK